MTSLPAEACLGPEKYTIVSAGIDKLFETVRMARDSSANQLEIKDGVAVNVTANKKPLRR
jgi:arginine deiminase